MSGTASTSRSGTLRGSTSSSFLDVLPNHGEPRLRDEPAGPPGEARWTAVGNARVDRKRRRAAANDRSRLPPNTEQPDLRVQLVGPWRHCNAGHPDPRRRYHLRRELRPRRWRSLQRRVRPAEFPGPGKRLAGSERRSVDLGDGAQERPDQEPLPDGHRADFQQRCADRRGELRQSGPATACPASVSSSATRTRRTTTSSLDGAEEPASFRFPRSSTGAKPCWQRSRCPILRRTRSSVWKAKRTGRHSRSSSTAFRSSPSWTRPSPPGTSGSAWAA